MLDLFKNIHTTLVVLLLDLVKRIHTILLGYRYWILFKTFIPPWSGYQGPKLIFNLFEAHIYLRYQDQYNLDAKFVLYITSGTCYASIGTRLIFPRVLTRQVLA
jgi:hypothetical protein